MIRTALLLVRDLVRFVALTCSSPHLPRSRESLPSQATGLLRRAERPLRWQSSPPMPLAVVQSDEVPPSIPGYANGKSVGAVASDLDLTESAATESERRTLRRCLPRMREHQRLMSRSDGGGRRRSTAVTAPKGRPRIVEPATSDSYGIGGGGCVQAFGRGSMTGIARRNS